MTYRESARPEPVTMTVAELRREHAFLYDEEVVRALVAWGEAMRARNAKSPPP